MSQMENKQQNIDDVTLSNGQDKVLTTAGDDTYVLQYKELWGRVVEHYASQYSTEREPISGILNEAISRWEPNYSVTIVGYMRTILERQGVKIDNSFEDSMRTAFGSELTRGEWITKVDRIRGLDDNQILENEIIPLHGSTSISGRLKLSALISSKSGKSSEQLKYAADNSSTEGMLPNAWLTEIRDQKGSPLFRGIRTGTLSHYGDQDPASRQRGAKKMAEQLVCQLVALSGGKLPDKGIADSYLEQEVLQLPVVSIDLQTRYPEFDLENPKTIEQRVVDEQRSALESLEGLRSFTLESGQCIRAFIEPILLNLPTTGPSIRTGIGYDDVTLERNNDAIGRLLSRASLLLNEQSNPVVEYLVQEIGSIWKAGTYLRPGADPYRIVSHMLLLSHHLGIVPHFNCRSGKDRTAMADAEVKLLAARLHALPTKVPREISHDLDNDESRLLFDLASGVPNSEVQRLNTGVPGSKLKPPFPEYGERDPLVRRIGGGRWSRFKGFADLLGIDD